MTKMCASRFEVKWRAEASDESHHEGRALVDALEICDAIVAVRRQAFDTLRELGINLKWVQVFGATIVDSCHMSADTDRI